jgi:translation initiation factor IF-1
VAPSIRRSAIPDFVLGILNSELGFRIEGVVRQQQPGALYEVELEDARRIIAHASPGAERNFVRLLVGDRVAVELTARDVTRGRIVKRL